jgi:AcrR family transcriptional regulator
MGAEHPAEGLLRKDPDSSSGCTSGCFSNCPTCRRLRKAAVELTVRDGLTGVTIEAIAEFAEVPPERAAEHYATLEDCLAAAYDEGALRLRRACSRALGGGGSWHERLHAAVDAAVEEFSGRPELARYCTMVALRSDLPVLCATRLAARERIVAILSEQRGGDADGEDLPELRFEVLVGAANHALREQLDGDLTPGAVRARLDQVIDLFEPAPAGR